MKKTLRILMVALVATILASGSAFAASALYRTYVPAVVGPPALPASSAVDPYTIGLEWLAGQTSVSVDYAAAPLVPGGPAAFFSSIDYVPGIDLGIDNTLTFTVTKGALAANTSYGLFGLGAGDAALVDFTVDANGDYTELLFKLTRAIPEGTPLSLTGDGAAPGPTNGPVLVATAASLSGSPMTIAVTSAKDGTGQPLSAPVASAIPLLKSAAQLSASVQHQVAGFSVDGVTSSVIDVESDRLNFLDEGAGEDTPTATTSEARVLVASAIVNNGIDVSTAAYTLTVGGNQTAILSASLNTTAMVEAADSFTITSNFATDDLTVDGSNVILITVDGLTVLDTSLYTVTLVIDPAEAGVDDVTSLNAVPAFNWSINAMQAKVPYFILNAKAAGYSSFMKVANESSSSADLSVDALVFNFTDNINEPAQRNVFIAAIPALSNTTVSDDHIATALGLDPAKIYHVALTCTVVVPQNKIQISAYQKDTVGRTAIPVLYNTNNANDGRVWQ